MHEKFTKVKLSELCVRAHVTQEVYYYRVNLLQDIDDDDEGDGEVNRYIISYT